eukprot:GHRR01005268.1.p1 GENE.GHRR01005268.1~~GHRR01005268.1.p1  ORF type:complete len:114 (+),score=28.82 GHRR01005268.1:158-499(+)
MSTASLRHHWRNVSSTDNLQAFNVGVGDISQGLQHQHSGLAKLTGFGMISLAAALLMAEAALLVAKLLPSATSWLQLLQEDQYYIYLVPLMVPIILIAVTVNWFSLKLFKHNS